MTPGRGICDTVDDVEVGTVRDLCGGWCGSPAETGTTGTQGNAEGKRRWDSQARSAACGFGPLSRSVAGLSDRWQWGFGIQPALGWGWK